MNKLTYFLVASVMFTLASCGEPDYPEAQPSVVTQNGRLLVINTIAGANAIDVTLDNKSETPVFNDLPFATSQGYKNVQAGPNRLIEYFDAVDGSFKLVDRFSVVSNTSYTSFYYSVNPSNAAAVRRITDNLATPDVGFAHIRFLHFAKDAPAVRVTTAGGAAEVFSSRAYAALGTNNAFTNFTPIAAGVYDLEVRDGSDNVVLTIDDLNLQSKRIYTIYAHGLVADASLNYSVITHN